MVLNEEKGIGGGGGEIENMRGKEYCVEEKRFLTSHDYLI